MRDAAPRAAARPRLRGPGVRDCNPGSPPRPRRPPSDTMIRAMNGRSACMPASPMADAPGAPAPGAAASRPAAAPPPRRAASSSCIVGLVGRRACVPRAAAACRAAGAGVRVLVSLLTGPPLGAAPRASAAARAPGGRSRRGGAAAVRARFPQTPAAGAGWAGGRAGGAAARRRWGAMQAEGGEGGARPRRGCGARGSCPAPHAARGNGRRARAHRRRGDQQAAVQRGRLLDLAPRIVVERLDERREPRAARRLLHAGGPRAGPADRNLRRRSARAFDLPAARRAALGSGQWASVTALVALGGRGAGRGRWGGADGRAAGASFRLKSPLRGAAARVFDPRSLGKPCARVPPRCTLSPLRPSWRACRPCRRGPPPSSRAWACDWGRACRRTRCCSCCKARPGGGGGGGRREAPAGPRAARGARTRPPGPRGVPGAAPRLLRPRMRGADPPWPRAAAPSRGPHHRRAAGRAPHAALPGGVYGLRPRRGRAVHQGAGAGGAPRARDAPGRRPEGTAGRPARAHAVPRRGGAGRPVMNGRSAPVLLARGASRLGGAPAADSAPPRRRRQRRS
jgi:hypothetical protein